MRYYFKLIYIIQVIELYYDFFGLISFLITKAAIETIILSVEVFYLKTKVFVFIQNLYRNILIRIHYKIYFNILEPVK